jgi:hypothetical protein
MTSPSRESAGAALGFRATFRQIASRYPSNDEIVIAGRALHDRFYAVLAQASAGGVPADPFVYERFVECMATFAAGVLPAAEAGERIGALGAAIRV